MKHIMKHILPKLRHGALPTPQKPPSVLLIYIRAPTPGGATALLFFYGDYFLIVFYDFTICICPEQYRLIYLF